MPIIYLDHNVISDIAGIPGATNSEKMRAHALALKGSGANFALSIWNLYEIARSSNSIHIERCITFVEELNPLWLDVTIQIEALEIKYFLKKISDKAEANRNVRLSPFHKTIDQLCRTLVARVGPEESLRDFVAGLKAYPLTIPKIEMAAKETVDSIKILRDARERGLYRKNDVLLDIDYIQLCLGSAVSKNQIDSFGKKQIALFAESHTLAAHETLFHLWTNNGFTPELSDAIDMQHGLGALGYCDYFVTNDKRFADDCNAVAKRLALPCVTTRFITQITLPNRQS